LGNAWIDGAQAPHDAAVAAAAQLIAGSRRPLFTGLSTDVAGVKAALRLARIAGGVVDHAASARLYRNIEVLRSSGMFLAVPAEMRRRADRFLVIGGDAASLAPELLAFLFGGTRDLGRPAGDGGDRRIVWLGAGDAAGLPANGIPVEAVPCRTTELADAGAMIRAALAGRRFGKGPIAADTAAEIAAWLKAAGFACVVWSAEALDALGVEMFAGLVADLNLSTRASSIPLGGPGEAWGAAQVATAVTGYPLRVGFAGGEAEHDAWAHDGARLLAAGEVDLVVEISSLAGFQAPDPASDVPLIVLGAAASASAPRPAIGFAVADIGAGSIVFRDEVASFVPVGGSPVDDGPPTAAEILDAIAAAMGGSERKAARPC
jgi:formylmethanofuran dehydrogenase subunit B